MSEKISCRAIELIATAALFGTALTQDDEFERVDLPDNIAVKVEGFDQDKIDFLSGEGALNFAGRHDLLFARLEDKSPQAVDHGHDK